MESEIEVYSPSVATAVATEVPASSGLRQAASQAFSNLASGFEEGAGPIVANWDGSITMSIATLNQGRAPAPNATEVSNAASSESEQESRSGVNNPRSADSAQDSSEKREQKEMPQPSRIFAASSTKATNSELKPQDFPSTPTNQVEGRRPNATASNPSLGAGRVALLE